jgi:hypothetical protein
MESFASGDYLPTLQDLGGTEHPGDLSYEALHLPDLHAPPETPETDGKTKGKKRKSDAGLGEVKVKKTRQSRELTMPSSPPSPAVHSLSVRLVSPLIILADGKTIESCDGERI